MGEEAHVGVLRGPSRQRITELAGISDVSPA